MVLGKGRVIGQAMVNSADINGISFTGSVPTGRGIAAACAGQGKAVQCEQGSYARHFYTTVKTDISVNVKARVFTFLKAMPIVLQCALQCAVEIGGMSARSKLDL